jgi:hypothetical protein
MYTHMCTHTRYDLGMSKNINTHNELKKLRIKWPQLVGDKDIDRNTHTTTHKAVTLT